MGVMKYAFVDRWMGLGSNCDVDFIQGGEKSVIFFIKSESMKFD